MEEANNKKKIIPKYADAGRKGRVEKYGPLANILWFEHCEVKHLHCAKLADDRLSTRASCQQADMTTDGVPTELMMWEGWKSGPFPQHLHVQVLASKIWMRDAYDEGNYVMLCMDGLRGVEVPFDLELPKPVMTRTATGMQEAYRFPLEQCKQIKLGKIRKELN